MQSQLQKVEVLVIGAGPAGLATAVTLASYGVDTLLVDRRASTSMLPRATVASTATMELLRRWGLEHGAWERSIEVEWRAWACATLAGADDGEPIEVGYPTRAQAAVVSPTRPACLAQHELEPLLEEHLRSLASARLERGVELVSLSVDRDGGHIAVLAGPGGRRRRVPARYVVGADGMRSRVRAELGIATQASEVLAKRIAVLFRAPVWDLVGEHRYGIYFITGGPADSSFLPAGRPDRWIFGMSTDGSGDERVSHREIGRRIRDAAGDAALPIEIERAMPVAFATGLADRFRAGNAFLVGDAAHRVTPRGGTGLNTAVRDGFDVGWKLAWVLRGWSDERLLDSYERERRPVAEHNAERSSRSDGSIFDSAAGLSADIGGRIAHVWVPRDGGLVSTLDLLGDGLTLFAAPDWSGTVEDAGFRAPMSVQRLDAISARGLGLGPTGALLARPDGHPIALWSDPSSSFHGRGEPPRAVRVGPR